MLNIKKQINLLYIISILGNLSVAGAWVAILAARGFSLVQIGFAETVFHITSFIFEIPSGVLADIYGRKRMLLVSHIMAIIGDVIMVLSEGFGLVCVSFVFQALSYNSASGSGDALAYDSLKSVNQEKRYERYASNQLIIYRIGNGISTLCAGMALFMGYRLAYFISAVTHFVTLLITYRLEEVKVTSGEAERSAGQTTMIGRMLGGLSKYCMDSILFLKNHGRAAKLMFFNSLAGAVDILLLFFLQSKLTSAGIPDWGGWGLHSF